MLADLHTPVGVYMRLRDVCPQSVLMESSDYHESDNSRSFIGINPVASVAVGHGTVVMSFPDGTSARKNIDGDYRCEDAMREFLDRFDIGGAYACHCGLYGYTSFNAVRYFEDIAVKDETAGKNDAPDIYYMMFRDVIVFDHFNNSMTVVTLVANGDSGGGGCADTVIDAILKRINGGGVRDYGFHAVGGTTLSDEEHKANIRRGIKHCLRGDVFQIVLSRRFVQRYEGDDFKLYRVLRSVNPSPYLFYFDFCGFRIFGSSPETHCRIDGRRAYRRKPDSCLM